MFIAFWLKNTDITDVSIFSFYCYFIREAPHRFQRSISWKRILFRLWKNDTTDVSLFASYCCFIQEARHRLRKKEINLLAQQTICLRTLNEQTLMRKSLCVYGRKFQSSSLGVCCLNEILCAPSFGGGLHQRFTFFSAVHMWNEIDCKRFLQSPLVVMSFWTQWTTVVSRN